MKTPPYSKNKMSSGGLHVEKVSGVSFKWRTTVVGFKWRTVVGFTQKTTVVGFR